MMQNCWPSTGFPSAHPGDIKRSIKRMAKVSDLEGAVMTVNGLGESSVERVGGYDQLPLA